MEYQVSSEVLRSFKQFEKRSILNNYILLFILIAGSIGLYATGNLDASFYVCDALMVATLLCFFYSQTVPKGRIINNTVTTVEISNDEIRMRTPSFKVLFWINKFPKELTMEIKKVRIQKAMYPVKKIYDLDNYVFSIIYQKQEFYVIPDFFDEELRERFISLLRY